MFAVAMNVVLILTCVHYVGQTLCRKSSSRTQADSVIFCGREIKKTSTTQAAVGNTTRDHRHISFMFCLVYLLLCKRIAATLSLHAYTHLAISKNTLRKDIPFSTFINQTLKFTFTSTETWSA